MAFNGRFELISSVNYEEYLKAVDVPEEIRKAAVDFKPIVEISQNGDQCDQFTIKTTTPLKTQVLTFSVGQEFEELTADGRKSLSKVVLEGGNKLVHHQKIGTLDGTITREMGGNEMTVTLVGGGVTATRKFKKTA